MHAIVLLLSLCALFCATLSLGGSGFVYITPDGMLPRRVLPNCGALTVVIIPVTAICP